jgi:hypothetical protein
MGSVDLREVLEQVIPHIQERINNMPKYGDMADFGNEIGYCVGKAHLFNEEDIEDFITGLQHGISLTNGTH